jgi:hypothetical protein
VVIRWRSGGDQVVIRSRAEVDCWMPPASVESGESAARKRAMPCSAVHTSASVAVGDFRVRRQTYGAEPAAKTGVNAWQLDRTCFLPSSSLLPP